MKKKIKARQKRVPKSVSRITVKSKGMGRGQGSRVTLSRN